MELYHQGLVKAGLYQIAIGIRRSYETSGTSNIPYSISTKKSSKHAATFAISIVAVDLDNVRDSRSPGTASNR